MTTATSSSPGVFDLPIVRVVARSVGEADAPMTEADSGAGVAVHSSNESWITLDGLPVDEAKAAKITAWLAERTGLGRKAVNYKLRDWLCSAANATGASRSRSCSMGTIA